MAFLWQGALLLSLAAAILVDADMTLDCRRGSLMLVWTETRPWLDLSLLLLGNCPPGSVSPGEARFNVDINDCNFRRLVTGNELAYSNDLTYNDGTLAFAHPVICSYERPNDWRPPYYEPVFYTYGHGTLDFHMGLMNDDFSGPAPSTAFPLGSFIPIMATVAQMSHQPLLLLLDECVATTTPELHPESHMYPIITNKGCLVDSKMAHSRFEPRQKTSEIRLLLQAFKFAVGEQVFIHCNLVAWDPSGFEKRKKACQYVKGRGWELLDDPSFSSVCSCCETTCRQRNKKSAVKDLNETLTSGNLEVWQNAVLGPLQIF